MDENEGTKALHFEVGAGLVLKLGQDLITDSFQAVMELVKNAYDADSSWVSVDVNTSVVCDDVHCQGARGYVRVLDNGHGMTLEDLQRGWLTIAQSRKQKMKAEGRQTSDKKRTPLGDKGLGRLGTQALGRYVQIMTRPKGMSEALTIWIDWDAFHMDKLLSAVDIVYTTTAREPHDLDGTTITVWGLTYLDGWSTPEAKKDLEKQLAKLISPFWSIAQFSVTITIDGSQLDLLDLGRKVRQAAATTYSFKFDGIQLEMTGEAKLSYCRPKPSNGDERERAQARFSAYVSSDGGEKLFYTLEGFTARKTSGMRLRRSTRPGWFAQATSRRMIEDLPELPRTAGQIVSPGPFSGELDTFVFSREEDLGVPLELKEPIKNFVGIRVYRDGFGIQLVNDWLGLASKSTRGGSYFELKVENTVGFVAITTEHNAQLEETSDRQRFKEDTPAFRLFQRLMMEVIKFVGEFQELLRRETSNFLSDEASRSANVDPGSSIAQISERFDAHVAEANAAAPRVEKQRATLQRVRERVKAQSAPKKSQAIQLSLTSNGPDPEVVQLLRDVDGAVEETQTVLDSVNGLLARASEVAAMRSLLVERFEVLDRQTVLLHETASLGISAEVMAHEIAQIADGLLQRATTLLRAARKGPVEAAEVIRFTEHVRSQSNALQQQANHITPALRYVRERRGDLNVPGVVDEVVKYHASRLLERRKITLTAKTLGDSPFVVLMNQGKLTQVLDNLILNAEYWVTEHMHQGHGTTGAIEIEVERPFIRISDSGAGVDPAIEELLFEQPFITTKKDGRGLGLFLCRRMLESDGCKLTLAPDRNKRDRRHKFLIDLSGVLRDSN